MKSGSVYLIHLGEPMAHARHYIGWARSVAARLAHHRRGTGAGFLAVAAERGIEFDVVRTWQNADKIFERHLKNRKNARRLCPVCRERELEAKGVKNEN